MSQEAPVTVLPVKPSALKRWSKRAVVTTVVVAAAALIAAKVKSTDTETGTETPSA